MIKVLKFPLTSKRTCMLLHLSTAKTKVALLYHLSKWPLFSLLSDILTSHPVKERFILSQNPIAVKRPWKEAGGGTFPQLFETYSLKCDFSLYFICKNFITCVFLFGLSYLFEGGILMRIKTSVLILVAIWLWISYLTFMDFGFLIKRVSWPRWSLPSISNILWFCVMPFRCDWQIIMQVTMIRTCWRNDKWHLILWERLLGSNTAKHIIKSIWLSLLEFGKISKIYVSILSMYFFSLLKINCSKHCTWFGELEITDLLFALNNLTYLLSKLG